jgi:membrane-associated protease RseP (regulator of RpoE activity)
LSVLLSVPLASCLSPLPPVYIFVPQQPLADWSDRGSPAGELTLQTEDGGERARLLLPRRSELATPFLGLRPTATLQHGPGILLGAPYKDSPAEHAGILAGDVLTHLDQQQLPTRDDLARAEANLTAGQKVTLRLLRRTEAIQVALHATVVQIPAVATGEIPLQVAIPGRFSGLVLGGVDRSWRRQLPELEGHAVWITAVDLGTPAWRAGLRPGDRILRLDGLPVADTAVLAADIETRFGRMQHFNLQVRGTDGQLHEVVVAPSDRETVMEFWIPLLMHVQHSRLADAWSIGPFGLLAGRQTVLTADPDRAVQTRRRGYGPLYLFDIEVSRHGSRWDFLGGLVSFEVGQPGAHWPGAQRWQPLHQ